VGRIAHCNPLALARGGCQVDLVRELAPDYAADRSRASEVHEYASALSKELFARALARPVAPGRAPVVAFLAGGGGSGKSTAGGPTIDATNPDIIVDGTLSNVDRAHREIQASLASDRDVRILYVYRSPEKSVEGAINRAIFKGRPVPVDALAEAHANAAKTVKALAQTYNGNARVGIAAIWNDGEIKENRPLPVEEIPNVDQQQAEHTFRTAIESANTTGKLTPHLYRGFLPARSLDTRDRKENEKTRPQQYAQDPVTTPENNTTQETTPIATDKQTRALKTGPASKTPTPHATEPSAANMPQPAQSQAAIDPQQQRKAMADAFRQDPAQAAEAFPELARAHNAFAAVAKRAAAMKSPQRRNQLLALLQTKLAKRIENDLSLPSPRQAVEWAANLVNGRGRGD